MDFVSENMAPVHPLIVDAVVRANDGYTTNFEQEAWTQRAVATESETIRSLLDVCDRWSADHAQ